MTTESTGKGRPTPKRKDAQAKVTVLSLSPVFTKEQKRAQQVASRQDRVNSRTAYFVGSQRPKPLLNQRPDSHLVPN